MNELITISSALFAGLIMSRIIKPLKLPAVTAYLIAGIIIGPYCLGRFNNFGFGFSTTEAVSALSIFSDVALGFIAFAIGNEFRLEKIKSTGIKTLTVGLFEALMATIFVDIALIILHYIFPEKLSLPAAITIGAIASATAPAATLMVIRQYKAKGKLTSLLLQVVAIDDAIALMVFAVSMGIAKALSNGSIDIKSVVFEPVLEIILSLLLGALMGALLTLCEKPFHSRSKRMSLSITFILVTVAISMMKFNVFNINISFSPLLVCMMLGTVFCNMCDFSEELMERTDGWTTPLFILFFVMSGAELDLPVFSDIIIVSIGVLYIITRSLGKYVGAFLGTKITHCDKGTQKYLGYALFPQAGVALGMSLTAIHELGESGIFIRNIVLFAIMIYELFGPVITKMALVKVGDIVPGAVSARKRNKNT